MKQLEVKHSYGEGDLKNMLLYFIYSKLEAYDADFNRRNREVLDYNENNDLTQHCFGEEDF